VIKLDDDEPLFLSDLQANVEPVWPTKCSKHWPHTLMFDRCEDHGDMDYFCLCTDDDIDYVHVVDGRLCGLMVTVMRLRFSGRMSILIE
jgi:hypothetical protein